jgi:hypothetical protein
MEATELAHETLLACATELAHATELASNSILVKLHKEFQTDFLLIETCLLTTDFYFEICS